jgi:UDPglucose 6-dehydrogenase
MASEDISCAVVGLGKLGLPYAALLANSGIKVNGLDLNQERIEQISNLNLEPEPLLSDLVRENLGRNLLITQDWEFALKDTNASFIIVPTPSANNDLFSNEYVLEAVTRVANITKFNSQPHVIVIVSTVMPTTCDEKVVPLIKEIYGEDNYGAKISLIYSPEFIALGTIVKNMEKPDMILIGESDAWAGDLFSLIQGKIARNQPPILRMSFSSAELTKLFINTYVTSKISFANMVAEISQEVENANVGIILEALGLDSRIGGKYLKAGLGYGGPCFPRDTRALNSFSKLKGVDATLVRATDEINRRQPLLWISRIERLIQNANQGKIAILGLSYKPGSFITDESQAVQIANLLARRGFSVGVHDPLVEINSNLGLDPRIHSITDLNSLDEFDLLVVAVPWPEYEIINTTRKLLRI